MKILIIGSGGREHVLAWKAAQSPRVKKIYCAPGNAGIAEVAECVPIRAMDFHRLADFAVEHQVDLTIVGMDDPLVGGIVDVFEDRGLRIFGPRKNAAILEGSKAFSKDLMKKYGIPTAAYEVFEDMQAALDYLETAPVPAVVKADGLALGKGVIIAETREDAKAAVRSMMEEKKFGDSGSSVVIEEFLTGPEVSVLSFTDGHSVIPMISSQDHKRALDGDKGLNTGGMGTVAPNPYYTEEVAARCMEEIFQPTIEAMVAEGRPFKGCLYFGLMITEDGPKVIEYNCRFGDPEAQVVLPLLESDLLTVMEAVTDEKLAETEVKFSADSACCVVVASGGYPLEYKKGCEITMGEMTGNTEVFVAGAKLEEGKLLTSGGRVLGVTSVAPTLEEAIDTAYENAAKINFENAYYRKDIGARALRAGRK